MGLKPKMLQDETYRSLKMISDVGGGETRKDAQPVHRCMLRALRTDRGKTQKEMDHCPCLLYERTNSN